MDESNIFPNDIINNTIENHIIKHKKRTSVFFWTLFCFLICILVSLPLIKLDIYSTSTGLIVSEDNMVDLTSPATGKIEYFGLKENQIVELGDTLLIVDQAIIQEKMALEDLRYTETEGFISDLTYLLSGDFQKVKTPRFSKNLIQYKRRLANSNYLIENSRAELNRYQTLFKKGVIAESEYNQYQLELQKLLNERANIINETRLNWQNTLIDLQNSLRSIVSARNQLEKEKLNFVLTSPLKGEIINSQGLNLGSFLTQGAFVANLSPSRNLIVESYVSPAEIGFLRVGMEIKYQIHSYNSNYWGFASGTIIEIGKDLVAVNGTPVFKIRSSIDQNSLSLKNGVRGELKKGMTLTSRFFLTKRSLFQLLFEEVEEWFNPYLVNENK